MIQINKYSKVATNKNNGLGRTLLSWGGGLIGASLYLKGLLDPEITTGVITAAIWTMPHKLFVQDNQLIGVGEIPVGFDNCNNVILNGVLYSPLPGNPSLADDDEPLSEECCSWESTGYPVVWDGGFCKLIPPSSNCEVDPDIKEVLFEDIVLSTPSNQNINFDTDLNGQLFGPFEGDTSDGNYYSTTYANYYNNLLTPSTVWNIQNNPNYPNGLPEFMVLTSDGEPLSEECCSEDILGFSVAPYIMGIGSTALNGNYQYQTYYFGCFCTADCTEDEDIVVVTPTGTTCPPVGDIELNQDGMLMDGVNDIPSECCTNGNYSTVTGVAGLDVEPIYDNGTYMGCGVIVPPPNPCCDESIIQGLFDTLELLQTAVSDIENQTQGCYDNWLSELNDNYQDI